MTRWSCERHLPFIKHSKFLVYAEDSQVCISRHYQEYIQCNGCWENTPDFKIYYDDYSKEPYCGPCYDELIDYCEICKLHRADVLNYRCESCDETLATFNAECAGIGVNDLQPLLQHWSDIAA